MASSRVLPPATKYRRTAVSMPERMWQRLEAANSRDNESRDPPDRLSRDKYMEALLTWALDQRERDIADEK